ALTLCPAARLPMVSPGRFAYRAWSWDQQGWGNLMQKETPDSGSYGQNEWICDRLGDEYWKNRNNIKKPDNVPLFFDCAYLDVFPNANTGRLSLRETGRALTNGPSSAWTAIRAT
ncbi:MAG TPA: hypothetical protein VMW24_18400, partial [Sedimentisphaerales bacterium]|nr:hypothetical protein [Sedimentisphaerales bacterium]